ncbi:hypothetical protein ASZ78_003242 [Callipepla squamata]|uniref:VWFA domain-containing protein n=1 Tax=Callipepla squamata TaxID=9009 RepID=A0A226MCP4_CALSU|nr:hypothetical protein ASZ78_003242 [Callipepla squamata]
MLQHDGKSCRAIDLCNGVDHGCEFKCVSSEDSFHCVCPEGQQLQADGKTCSKCGAGHVDLVMVIDGSKSVRPQNFELVKQFVNGIVDLLEVSPDGTRVGLVQYSSRVRTEFPLNKYHSAEEIKAAVMKMEYMEKGTMTGLALKHMVEHSFSELEGARPLSHNVPRIGLVFTDGRSQDDISEWAQRAKESGIVMFAVGVGKAVEEELRAIASEPVEQHFSYSADFTTMTHLVENFKLNICPAHPLAQMTVRLEALEKQIALKK